MGCQGNCCAVFYFPSTLTALNEGRREIIRDGEYIADMLIELTNGEAVLRAESFGFEAPGISEASEGHFFTCRHWDEETKLCGDYENRPAMCREYPYSKQCAHGCDCTDGTETNWKTG